MEKTKIMICGASGFIGHNLFEYFSSLDNHEVYGTYFNNKPHPVRGKMSFPGGSSADHAFQAGRTSNGADPKIVPADLRDKETALRVTKDMDIVINAAAAKVGGIGIFSVKENARDKAETNNPINSNLAEAAHINGVKHFIFLSCTVMYPSSDIPLAEESIDIEKINPIYSISAKMKIFGEDCCRHYADLGSTKYTVVRHTNIYGPHDKFDLAYSHVLASTIVKVMRAEREITVWGQGTETRDFLYISDLLDFIKTAIDRQKNGFEVFNVGFGKTYSINDLVKIITSCFNKKLTVIHDLQKPTIDSHISINVEKARRLLNWKANVGLREGLIKTIEWYKKNQ